MMSTKNLKRVHWIFTGLVAALTLMSVGMYLTNPVLIKATLVALGFPEWLFYHILFAKLAGATFVLIRKWPKLTEWAYAGLTFEFCLALSAHSYVDSTDPDLTSPAGAIIALTLLMISYATKRMLETKA
jgi:hypothetical protein